MSKEGRCIKGHIVQKEGCIICKEIYYSVCCHATMPHYPDNDFCPKCGEHTEGYTQEDIEREEGQDGRLLK